MLNLTGRKDYLALLKRLLPQGLFYRNVSRPNHPFEFLLNVAASEYSKAHNRLLEAINEFYPSSANETLESWEDLAGINSDDCITRPETTEARQALVAARLHSEVDNSSSDFYKIATQYGATSCFIQKSWGHGVIPGHPYFSSPFGVVGGSRVGFCWTFHLTGVPFEARDNLECSLKQAVPAGIQLTFDYGVSDIEYIGPLYPSPIIPILRF